MTDWVIESLDADIQNADWARTLSWDLPTEKDEFLQAIGGEKELAAFMKRPAAKAMPAALRLSLATANALAEAFKILREHPGHPNQKVHGRRKGAGTVPKFNSTKEAEGWANTNLAPTKFSFTSRRTVLRSNGSHDVTHEMLPDVAQATVEQFADLKRKYPNVPLARVFMAELDSGVNGQTGFFMAEHRDPEIALSRKGYGDKEGAIEFRLNGTVARVTHFTVQGPNAHKSTIIHEYGHVLDDHIRTQVTLNRVPGDDKAWADKTTRLLRPAAMKVSGYARWSLEEGLAEVFSEYHHRGAKASTETKRLMDEVWNPILRQAGSLTT